MAEERMIPFQTGGGPFVAAVEATRVPMVITDPTMDGDPIVYVNEAFINVFDKARDKALSQNYFLRVETKMDPDTENIPAANTAEQPLNQERLQGWRRPEPSLSP
jgi:hypothetical protein